MKKDNSIIRLLLDDILKTIFDANKDAALKGISKLIEVTESMGVEINTDARLIYTNFETLLNDGSKDESKYNDIRSRASRVIKSKIPKFLKTEEIFENWSEYNSQIHFANDSLLEKFIKDNIRDINWIKNALIKARSVCRVLINSKDESATKSYGTGFLVSDGYMFTNNHVIPNRQVADLSEIEFNFDSADTSSKLDRPKYSLDSSDFITDQNLDYTRVKVIEDKTNSISKWGVIEIDNSIPDKGELINIIHHPKGAHKHISLLANLVSGIEGFSLEYRFDFQYDASTDYGSSGSPVFNNKWKAIGIHHSRSPVGIESNRGTLFYEIVRDLKKKRGASQKT